jgi:uncharacterized membrane protein
MSLPPAQPGPSGPSPRRRLRGAFLAFSLGLVAIGALLLGLALDPAVFGLARRGYSFPYAGGLVGLFLLVWGLLMLVRLAFWSARAAAWGPRGPGGRRWDPAIAQARQRYARGEITREQFLQIVQDLRPPGPPPP